MTFACALVAHPTQIADAAVAALLAEAELTPKPGLVDRCGRGAHTDMDLPLLRRAVEALRPWFVAFVTASRRRGEPSGQLRRELAVLGRSAEADMLAATGGVNTHRGAIWALGLLTAAVTLRVDTSDARSVAATAAAIARHPDYACPPEALPSHGTRVRAAFGAHGARGQAGQGFPHVVEVGLPTLQAARLHRGVGGNDQADGVAGHHGNPRRHMRPVPRRARRAAHGAGGCGASAACRGSGDAAGTSAPRRPRSTTRRRPPVPRWMRGPAGSHSLPRLPRSRGGVRPWRRSSSPIPPPSKRPGGPG